MEAGYRVIQNGVDLTRIPGGNDEDRRAAREKHGLSDPAARRLRWATFTPEGKTCLSRLGTWSADSCPMPSSGSSARAATWRCLAPEPTTASGSPASAPMSWTGSCVRRRCASFSLGGMSLGMLEAMAADHSLVVTNGHGAQEAVEGVGAIVPPEPGRKFDIEGRAAASPPIAEITALHRPV